MRYLFTIVFFFNMSYFFMSCDMAYEKRISKKYYLVATDDKSDVSLRRKLADGDYIGRIPARVRAYAVVNDTFIFVKTAGTSGIKYYILNTVQDHDYSEIKDVVVGPLDSLAFYSEWLNKYPVMLTPVD